MSGTAARASGEAIRPGESIELMERALCEAFAEALGVDQIGPDDDFFDLGGHSLLVMRAAARIETSLGVRVPVSFIFEQPTVRSLAPLVSALEVVTRRENEALALAPRPAGRETGATPIPALQRGMWFLDQGAGRHAAYLLPDAWRLRGPLDTDALQRALHSLLHRHPALTMRYTLIDGVPHRTVGEHEAFTLPIQDLSALNPNERESTVSRLIAEEADRPFDLSHDPLLRASLLHLASDEHVLLLTVHHLAADAWSQSVLRRDLADLYRQCRSHASMESAERRSAALEAEAPRLASSGTPPLHAERREQLHGYWQRQLDGLPLLELPADRRRSASWSDAGSELVFEISAPLTGRLEALASTSHATLQMLLLAAYQILLGRYSGQPDFGVATFAADRHADTFDAIGLFVNTIVLRADLSGDPSFRSMLARVRRTSLDGYDHRDLPFDTLVADLRPDRQSGPNPLTGVAFQYLPIADAPPALEGLEVSRIECRTARIRFDLEFTIRKEDGRLRVLVGYSSDLWERDTMVRFVETYQALLSAIADGPDLGIAELDCLGTAARDQQLRSWSGREVASGLRGVVHDLFATRAAASPDRIALVCGADQLTYGELHRRAAETASRLRETGINRGDVVAIHGCPAAAFVEAQIAILTVGAIYLPLDDTHPSERLAFMLGRANARAVLTGATPPDWLTQAVECVIDMNVAHAAPQAGAAPIESPPVTPDDPAYVMFTSGSTGQPKGVTVPHRGITRLVLDASYVDFQPADVVAFASNRAFDAATFEIWGALLNGAQLVEIDRHTLLSPPLLAEALRTHGITVMFMTAALFHQMAVAAPGMFAGLRCLIAGGDVVDPAAAAAVLEAGAPGRLLNGYGPTENTTFSTTFAITPDHSSERPVPIGRPITGSTCYVLGSRRELLPVGAIGELYVGGAGLALGYVNDEALTAERFVRHPFLQDERLYKTGDRARWRCDGQIEFLGRVDRQIKLRGHRIELEEIEHVLALHEAISACAVMLDTTRPADPRLVAYAAVRSGHTLASHELADYLRRRLPAYMVPAAFVTLPTLPLTANGKVDRAALAALRDRTRAAETLKAHTQPPDATQMETIVVRVFREVLRLDRVGSDDNFFDLGGDSLSSIALAGRLTSLTRRAVSVTDVFAHPTVSALASNLRRAQTRALPATLVEIRQGGTKTPIYFPPGVLGEVVVGDAITNALPGDVPLYAFRDPLNAPPAASLEAMAARFCADVNAFQPEGPISLAGYSFGGMLAYEMARQLRAAGREIRLVAIFDTGPDFSASTGARESLARVWRCLQNAPGWIAEDLLRSLNAEMPGRLWRSLKNQGRAMAMQVQTSAPQFVPRVEHLFDVRGWSPALYAHVDNNLKILEAFTYAPYDGAIVLFRAKVRPLLHAHTWDLGWQAMARSVRVIDVPGNHHTLMTEPHIHRLAQSLRDAAVAADHTR